MDIRLPGIDGIEALGRLRAEPATQEIPAAGFDAYQGKPLRVKDFVAAVEQLLEHRRKPGPSNASSANS